MGIETVGKLKVLTFGTGDILVSNTKDSKEDKVRTGVSFMQQNPPREIGEEAPEQIGENVYESDSEVFMRFEKVESVDVVIEALENIRQDL